MVINTKFNLGDVVYVVGEYKIYQAIVIEVRCIEHYVENQYTYQFEKETLEFYRLGNAETDQTEFLNTNPKKYVNYDGEYSEDVWFTPDMLFSTSNDALCSIDIVYLNQND